MNAALYPFSLPLRTPLTTASDDVHRREGFLLCVATEDHTGYGEASPLSGWTESFRQCERSLTAARDALQDGNHQTAYDHCTDTPAARHAVDSAILDVRARRAEIPLYQFLGGPTDRVSVPVNATIGDEPQDRTVHAANEAVADGFDCLKVKVGSRSPETDADRVQAILETVPDSTLLRVDANASWTESDVTRFLDTVDGDTIEYIEQPLPADDLTGHAMLRDRGIPIALDESVRNHRLETIADIGAADAVVLKPMAVGGIERTHELAVAATETGITPVLSTTVDTAIARTAATHVAASVSDPSPAGLATGDRFERDLVPNRPRIEAGQAIIPEGNGNGIAPTPTNDA